MTSGMIIGSRSADWDILATRHQNEMDISQRGLENHAFNSLPTHINYCSLSIFFWIQRMVCLGSCPLPHVWRTQRNMKQGAVEEWQWQRKRLLHTLSTEAMKPKDRRDCINRTAWTLALPDFNRVLDIWLKTAWHPQLGTPFQAWWFLVDCALKQIPTTCWRDKCQDMADVRLTFSTFWLYRPSCISKAKRRGHKIPMRSSSHPIPRSTDQWTHVKSWVQKRPTIILQLGHVLSTLEALTKPTGVPLNSYELLRAYWPRMRVAT